jgi:hypothetical protein
MLDKFAADDRIEQMNAQRRRMKQLEHRKNVDALLEERRNRMAHDKQKELDERVQAEQLEAYKRNIIEEERVKLLREHATKLLGYLPKGIIRNENDLNAMGDDFKRQYQKRQVNFHNDDQGWTNNSFK